MNFATYVSSFLVLISVGILASIAVIGYRLSQHHALVAAGVLTSLRRRVMRRLIRHEILRLVAQLVLLSYALLFLLEPPVTNPQLPAPVGFIPSLVIAYYYAFGGALLSALMLLNTVLDLYDLWEAESTGED